MRILFLSNLFPPDSEGGLELSAYEAATGLAARGYDVEVLTTRSRGGARRAEVASFPVHRLLEYGFHASHYGYDPRSIPTRIRDLLVNERVGKQNVRIVEAFVAQHQFDVVSIWGVAGVSCAVALPLAEHGVPVVWNAGDFFLRDRLRPHLLNRVLFAFFCRRWMRIERSVDPKRILVNSDYTRNGFIARGFPAERMAITYRGVPLELLSAPREMRDSPPTIAMACRLTQQKGVEVALRGLAEIRRRDPNLGVRLLIAGVGEPAYVRGLEDLARSLGIAEAVSLLGYKSHFEVISLMRRASIVLGATLSREYFGRVNVEAMACGTPLLVSATENVREFGESGVHLLTYPPGDAPGLAEGALRILRDPGLAEHLAAHAKRRVAERFLQERIVEQMEGHLLDAVRAAA